MMVSESFPSYSSEIRHFWDTQPMNPKSSNILIANNKSDQQERWQSLFVRKRVIGVVGLVESTQDLIDKLTEGNWQVLVVDYARISEKAISDVLFSDEHSFHLIITDVPVDAAVVEQCYNRGVSGFLAENATNEEFREAVLSVVANRQYFSLAFEQILLQSLTQNNYLKAPELIFSETEKGILRLLCLQRSPVEMASELSVSLTTVQRILQNLLVKTNSKQPSDLILFAIGEGYFMRK